MIEQRAADGRVFTYRGAAKGSLSSAGATGAGAFLTGLLGVGVGEVRSCGCSAPLVLLDPLPTPPPTPTPPPFDDGSNLV